MPDEVKRERPISDWRDMPIDVGDVVNVECTVKGFNPDGTLQLEPVVNTQDAERLQRVPLSVHPLFVKVASKRAG